MNTSMILTLALHALPLLSSSAPALPLAAPASVALAPATAAETGDLQAFARAAAAEAQQDPELLWSAATRLVRERSAAPGGLAVLATEIDAALAAGDDVTGTGERLLLVAARLQTKEPNAPRLAGHLARTIGTAPDGLARAASSLAGARPFRRMAGDAAEALYGALSTTMRDGQRPPATRLAAAVALFRIGAGAERRAARAEMKLFLQSSDPGLRSQGALALAKSGDVDTGRNELERLAELPGEPGRLAEAYLEQEEIRRYFDRRIKDLNQKAKERQAATEEGSFPELEQVEVVLQRIKDSHLEGDTRSRRRLVEESMDGMLRRLDSASRLVPSDEVAQIESPRPNGLGCGLGIDPSDGLLTVLYVNHGSAGESAGLRADDKLVRIDAWPTLRRPIDECLARLDPARAGSVDLYIWRRGMEYEALERPRPEMIHRATLRSSAPRPILEELLPEAIGLIEVRDPRPGVGRTVAEAWRSLSAAGARTLILDLRRAGGRGVELGVELADVFLPADTFVGQLESRVEETRRLYTQSEVSIPEDVPLLVLADRFTTGSAEMATGMLQDAGRARLVGERTAGDGSMRRALRVPGEIDDLFDDSNGNGRYDDGEEVTRDFNGNGRFDYAPRVLLPIAQLVLPSGARIRREIDEEGEVQSAGGLEPDVIAFSRSYAPWQIEEVLRVQEAGLIDGYLDREFGRNPELMLELHQDDSGRVGRYPGFGDLYPKLATLLAEQDVHVLVHQALRRRVQALRGTNLVHGDWETDHQLQRAIQTLLEDEERTWTDVPAFERVFGIDRETRAAGRLLAARLSEETRADLPALLDRLERSLAGELELSAKELDRLQDILSRALDLEEAGTRR